ncbi:hypothetical protein OQ622_15350, partial [Klebsiella pneumoniae]|nr:hypothetical protein [Klebsiella pneumoniae]MCX2614948.1 hypothetical protein [Klebsiella pneumoniae]
MDKQYLAINGALFFWLLALIAWSVDASALARLAAACALIAFLLHSQRNKINAMFIKKNKTEPQISEAATPPAIKEGANKQVISSQADSLIKISRIWADFFPANT